MTTSATTTAHGGSQVLSVQPAASTTTCSTENSFLEKRRASNRRAAKRARVRKEAFTQWLHTRSQQLDDERAFILTTLGSVQAEIPHCQTLHILCTNVAKALASATMSTMTEDCHTTQQSTSQQQTLSLLDGKPSTAPEDCVGSYRDHFRAMNRKHAQQSRKRKKVLDDSLQQKVEEQQVELGVYRSTLEWLFGRAYARALLSRKFPDPEAVSIEAMQEALKSEDVLPIDFPKSDESPLAKAQCHVVVVGPAGMGKGVVGSNSSQPPMACQPCIRSSAHRLCHVAPVELPCGWSDALVGVHLGAQELVQRAEGGAAPAILAAPAPVSLAALDLRSVLAATPVASLAAASLALTAVTSPPPATSTTTTSPPPGSIDLRPEESV